MLDSISLEEEALIREELQRFPDGHYDSDLGKIVYNSPGAAMAAYMQMQIEIMERKGQSAENAKNFRRIWSRTNKFIPAEAQASR